MEELTSQDEWIMDGNYGRTMDTRLQRADNVIFLDYPTRISLYRAIKRAIRDYGKTRPEMGEGCNERCNIEFFKWVLSEFENSFRQASLIISSMKGYIYHELQRCLEEECWCIGRPSRIIQSVSGDQQSIRNGRSCFISFTIHFRLWSIT